MCESNKLLRSPNLCPRFFIYVIFISLLLLLVVVGDTRACKSSVVGYWLYCDVTFTFVEFQFRSCLRSAIFFENRSRLEWRDKSWRYGMRRTGENTLGFRSDREWNQSNTVVNSNLNDTLSWQRRGNADGQLMLVLSVHRTWPKQKHAYWACPSGRREGDNIKKKRLGNRH